MAYLLYLWRLCLLHIGVQRGADDYVGRTIIVGMTFIDENGEVVEQYQTHGRISAIDDRRGVVIIKADGTGDYTIPPWPLRFKPAKPGEYRLRSSGRVVIDPDYLSTWTMQKTKPENIEIYKSRGIGPFDPREGS